jgi:H+-translocating NAD(P) transhydrogenase subunit alpha
MMILGVPRETISGERRVALVPDLVARLTKRGIDVRIERDAGAAAGHADSAYQQQGALLADDVFESADILLKVQPAEAAEIARLKPGAALIGLLQPFAQRESLELLAARGITAFAMELMPRISRAQSMDALSAMSTIIGYKAVLIAAVHLPRFFPLLMTAAGTVTPARVFVVGAGVAGLQAIGTARRLGAVVEAYDTRPVVREQVESLGAKFVEIEIKSTDVQESGGYARAQAEEFYLRQQAAMARAVAAADVVITTALVPGRRAPVLISEEMVRAMRPGSVVVDLAAEQGGNCALTEPGRDVVRHGVIVCGPVNLPSTLPFHASQMYARTVITYLEHLLRDGRIHLDMEDELTRAPLVTHAGKVLHADAPTEGKATS